jgi:hypothetical protein
MELVPLLGKPGLCIHTWKNILDRKSQAKRPLRDLGVDGSYNRKYMRMEAECIWLWLGFNCIIA